MLTDITYTITDNAIKVQSDHTSYINTVRRNEFISFPDLIKLYRTVIKLAKEKKISISYKNKFKQTIDVEYPLYVNDYNASQEVFEQLVSIYKMIQNRGIHSGTSDDIVLK